MDAATLAARVAYGYGRAATVIGRTTTIYRPTGTGAVIAQSNVIDTRLVAFDTKPDFGFVNPQKIDTFTYYALVNPTGLQVADYLVSVAGTFFVCSVDDVAPPMVTRCSTTMTISRQSQPISAGFQPVYSGTQAALETDLFCGVPMAIKIDRTGREPRARLPADAMGEPSHVVYGPAGYLAPGSVLERDILTDSTGLRYQVAAIEYEPLATVMRVQRLEA